MAQRNTSMKAKVLLAAVAMMAMLMPGNAVARKNSKQVLVFRSPCSNVAAGAAKLGCGSEKLKTSFGFSLALQ